MNTDKRPPWNYTLQHVAIRNETNQSEKPLSGAADILILFRSKM
jgi:hypothetical protein